MGENSKAQVQNRHPARVSGKLPCDGGHRPFPRFSERFFLFRREWFVVDRSVSNSERDGIEHGFEQADDGGELCRRKSVDQLMGVLFGVSQKYPSFLISHSPEGAVN
jgi:hypothetical protein